MTATTTTDTARAALAYIHKGIRVIPLRGKIPLLPAGWDKIDPDAAQVRAWWDKWPDADIGIRLELSGLVVVDVDSAEAQTEVDAWGVPPTLIARTAKGRHYYYRAEGLPAVRKIGAGTSGKIDVLSKGFVVAPPSTHATGHRYTWERHTKPVPAPPWVRLLLAPTPRPAPRPQTGTFPTDNDLDEARDALRVLDADMAHDDWITIGMSVHSIDAGAAGLAVWDEWSATGGTYKPGECERRWRSFTPGGGVTKSTIFGLARDRGWRPPHTGSSRQIDRGPGIESREERPGPNYTPDPDLDPDVTRPIVVTRGPMSWHFGATVRRIKTTHKDGQTDEDVSIIGADIWPTARTRAAENDAHGVAFDFRSEQGKRGTMIATADAWIGDRGTANRFAADAALAGVKVDPRSGADLAYALGWWSRLVEGAPTRTTVIRPGWHRSSVYVNGATVHGAPWHYTGASHRGQTRGTLDTWNAQIPRLARTHGTRLALGVAYCGALLAPLGRSGWVLHLAGASTTGKTRAAKLGASVWFDPGKTSTWNGTANGIEQTLEGYSGALVVLDEIKEAAPRQVGDIVHRISDNAGRVRSNRTGTGNQRQRTWSLTGLSTGETTVSDYLGAYAQGGHLVRCVDLWIERGEATTDAAHADEIDDFGRRCFGVAGDAFAQHLVENLDRFEYITRNAHDIADDLRDTAPDAEAQRVLGALALVGAAIIEANRAGVWPMDDAHATARQVIAWAMRKIVAERGDTTSPEERALRTLRELMQARPGLFPQDVDYATAREAVGVWTAGQLHTTEGMLKSSETWRAAGVSPRRWLAWLAERGDARRLGQCRIAGVKARWWVLDFEEDHDDVLF